MTPPRTPRLSPDEFDILAERIAANIEGNGLGKKINTIQETVQRLDLQFAHDHEHVEDHQKVLYGDKENEGLLEQVHLLVKQMSSFIKVIWIVVGSMLAFGVSFAIYMVATHPIP